jgi:hypothetical protein
MQVVRSEIFNCEDPMQDALNGKLTRAFYSRSSPAADPCVWR